MPLRAGLPDRQAAAARRFHGRRRALGSRLRRPAGRCTRHGGANIVPEHLKKAGRPAGGTDGQRRGDLLATAFELFITHGYADVTLAMVAQEAHVAVRTIYVKFGGKEELLRAIIAAQ